MFSIPDEYRNTDLLSIGTPIALAPTLWGMETLGSRVKKARVENKFSQQVLAKKAGMSQSALAELENGDSKESVHIVRLAVALKRSPYWLASGKGPEKIIDFEAELVQLSTGDVKLVMDMVQALQARSRT